MVAINYVIENIENIRKKKGVTKAFIAKKCSKTSSWYNDITKGKNRLSIDDFLNVAESLGEEPKNFFS